MKKLIIILVLILVGGGMTAKVFLAKGNKSSAEKERVLGYADDYSDAAEIFLTERIQHHHDEAFAAAYQSATLSPVSEFSLDGKYDEATYYRTLAKLLYAEAEKEGHSDAKKALIDIAKHYGVEVKF
ncbi:MAG: hypothetical protein ACPG32_03130 [Akkermansiaceae bacterium]